MCDDHFIEFKLMFLTLFPAKLKRGPLLLLLVIYYLGGLFSAIFLYGFVRLLVNETTKLWCQWLRSQSLVAYCTYSLDFTKLDTEGLHNEVYPKLNLKT